MSITIDTLVNAIRFDIDYHCTETRTTTPQQGTINKELFKRLEQAQQKGNPVLPTGLRVRVFNSLCQKATVENHALFDKALDIFHEKLEEQRPQKTEYYNTNVVILDPEEDYVE